jgi:peptidoglycan/LPS O-acetylase OafA/YrhL
MTSKPGFRGDIQALRAVAVGAVVIFHLWPTLVPGGYIGVNVFFVISGYLITKHLLDEAHRNGRIQLSHFYARRIRRLLPAAATVLGVTTVGIWAMSPTPDRQQFLSETMASALYVVNWVLALGSTDYFADDQAASPVQHFWTLSVEEQFYLAWPLLIIATLWATTKLGRHRTLGVRTVFAAVTVASFVYSVSVTSSSPDFAYFATPAHVWQFGLGGLLATFAPALAHRIWISNHGLRAAFTTAGLAAIAYSMFAFDGSTGFPGYLAAIPVLGAVAIIAAGQSEAKWAPTRLGENRAVQFIGDHSYGIYLWHWGPIVFLPLMTETALGNFEKLGIAVATVVLAWATRRFIERPAMTHQWTFPRRTSYGFASASSAAVVIACLVPITSFNSQTASAQEQVEDRVLASDQCIGAAALLTDQHCENRLTIDESLQVDGESDEFADVDLDDSNAIPRELQVNECSESGSEANELECTIGSREPEAVIALIGDSHAEHLIPALTAQLQSHNWQIKIFQKRSCPPVDPNFEFSPEVEYKENLQSCKEWRSNTLETVERSKDIDAVVAGAYTRKFSDASEEFRSSLINSLADTWSRLSTSGKQVVVVGDVPTTRSAAQIDECTEGTLPESACALDRTSALGPDAMTESVKATSSEAVQLLDITQGFCDTEKCYSAVGGLPVYSDNHHLTKAFSQSLANLIESPLEQASRQ